MQALQKNIEGRVKNEEELLIAPDYFLNLAVKNSFIKSVEILPKRGFSFHEMNCFRYDVILHIGSDLSDNNPKFISIDFTEDTDIDNILNHDDDVLILKNYPNKRIWSYCRLNEQIIKKNSNKNINDEIIYYNEKSAEWFEIEELYKLAYEKKYNLYISLSIKDKSCYDLFFYKESQKFLKINFREF